MIPSSTPMYLKEASSVPKRCEGVPFKSNKKSVNNDGLETNLVSNGGGTSEGHGTLYVIDVCEVLQRQAEVSCKEYIVFSPWRKERTSQVIAYIMTINLSNRFYKKEDDGCDGNTLQLRSLE